MAAVLGSLIGDRAPSEDAEFVLSHVIPLPIAIALGLLFVHRWSGWDARRVFRETPTVRLTPRRWWLESIPVLMVAISLAQVPEISWADQAAGMVLLVVSATIMVGVGEELFFRGILLESIRARHGELVTLLGTAASFGLGHIVGSLWAGVPPLIILFQVSALMMDGSLFYWVRRVTGRLWVAMAVHALTDCVLYLSSGATSTSDALMQPSSDDPNWLLAALEIALITAAVAGVISAAREDHRTRQGRRARTRTTEGDPT
jgi:membrane protease YdiL (CAAX protease family)